MATWQLQDAKARFSEVVDKAEKEGAQVITRRGVETVAIVPIEEWKRLTSSAKPTLKDLLLSREFVFDDLDKMIPKRGKLRTRKPIDLE
ncbi:MAG: type II toxin-antitoxin system Phd/YefM family antitoxin [Bryobacterales bacterium]|nr:type II toxin-antitoxin system Phd/YefM family antitoxin [Bryobacterales bacterium]